MATLTQLLAEVGSFIDAPDDADAVVVQTAAINDAIRRLDSRDWWWTLMQTSVTLTTNLQTYPLPTDFKAPRALLLLSSSGAVNGRIGYLDPKTADSEVAEWGVVSPGDPCFYTVLNSHESDQDDILFDVPPSSGFVSLHPTARFRYFRRTARLSTGSDTLDAPSEVERFVIWHACGYVATRYAPDKVRMAQEFEERAWRDLLADEMRVQTRDWQ